MTKTYFKLIKIPEELAGEKISPAFATLEAAKKYRTDILKDPGGLTFSIIEADEQGRPRSIAKPESDPP